MILNEGVHLKSRYPFFNTIEGLKSLTKICIKSSLSWQAFFLVESQMPFSYNMSGIAQILEFLSHGSILKGKAIWLCGPDDAVLKACVDLKKEGKLGNRLPFLKHLSVSPSPYT